MKRLQLYWQPGLWDWVRFQSLTRPTEVGLLAGTRPWEGRVAVTRQHKSLQVEYSRDEESVEAELLNHLEISSFALIFEERKH